MTENTASAVAIRIPDIQEKGGRRNRIAGAVFRGPKKVGLFAYPFSDGVFGMKIEILAIRENGIVFLIGFAHAAQPQKDSN